MELKKLGVSDKNIKKQFIQSIVEDWINNDTARVFLIKKTCVDILGQCDRMIGDIRVWEGANVSFVDKEAYADLYEMDMPDDKRMLFITNVYFGKKDSPIV